MKVLKVVFIASFCTVVSALFVAPCHAQENDIILREIDRARAAYAAKRYVSSVEALQEVIRIINEKLVAQLEQVFPKSFGGWETSGPRNESTGATSICVKQYFYKEDFPDHVEIEAKLKSPAAPNVRMWLANPRQMARSTEGTTITKVAGRRCIQRWDKSDQFAELMFLIGADTVVRIRGFNVKNVGVIEKFPEKMDLAALEEMFK